jgi:hypothetical protein
MTKFVLSTPAKCRYTKIFGESCLAQCPVIGVEIPGKAVKYRYTPTVIRPIDHDLKYLWTGRLEFDGIDHVKLEFTAKDGKVYSDSVLFHRNQLEKLLMRGAIAGGAVWGAFGWGRVGRKWGIRAILPTDDVLIEAFHKVVSQCGLDIDVKTMDDIEPAMDAVHDVGGWGDDLQLEVLDAVVRSRFMGRAVKESLGL